MNKGIIVILSFFFVLPVFAKITIGTVDMRKVITTVAEGKNIKSKLEVFFEGKQKLLKAEEKKIKKLQEEYKKQSLVMSEKAKQQKQTKLQELMIKIQQQSMSYQKEMQSLEEKYKRPLLVKVNSVIEAISKKQGVDMTFEISATPVLYAKNKKDLTASVIKAYDKKHPFKKKK
ncbi:MAG: OmpH family outer membrane protein [Bacteriovoracaceae bacterium]|nr:OmpH family outer membrane protein [Bacteriovoracaceae bacterium]